MVLSPGGLVFELYYRFNYLRGYLWSARRQKLEESVDRLLELLDRAQGGLGIGLALVQSLITLHRGRVEAQSTLGEGSEFTVTLPLLQSREQPPVEIGQKVPTVGHTIKVLVVDDNNDAADSVSMLLQTLGHDARLAHDGRDALRAALDYRPDVVLLDIGLPGADGFQVAKWIRREPALKDVVLVAVTGYGQESDRQQSKAAGFDYHLVKPVDFAKIEDIFAATADTHRASSGEVVK